MHAKQKGHRRGDNSLSAMVAGLGGGPLTPQQKQHRHLWTAD